MKFGVIGAGGYWGPNWVRVLLQAGVLGVVCDSDFSRLEVLAERFGLSDRCSYVHPDAVFDSSDIDGVFIVTPPVTHAALAIQALVSDKHVFIEKPLACSLEECDEIERHAKIMNKLVMVGHTFIFHPAVQAFKENLRQIGAVRTIFTVRANFGQYQSSGIVEDLLPHDLSIFNYLTDSAPDSVRADINPHQDTAFVSSTHGDVTCNAFLSWAYPDKTRKLVAVGARGILEWDLSSTHLQLHKKWALPKDGKFDHHDGSTETIYVNDQSEPLANELQHFMECIRIGQRPLQGLQAGRDVVKGLEQCR